ncbi:hypothetical protein [uncultured Microbacterium sp.]|uniref:hypothetical protein n=1 Tax=uncultured Microbacterium sp. TaxID=191216 RepID=UPI0025DBFFED|nr:hypothetical protein [uncultured Microbacterium sp.]
MTNGFVIPLRQRRDLATIGYDSRRIRRALDTGHLTLLRRGVFARTTELAGLTVEDRAVLRARAYAAIASVPPVFATRTAAALHGLPVVTDDEKTHVLSSADRPGSGYGVVRHRGSLGDDDVTEISGLRCTSLSRTIADLARTDARERAVSATDAALRHVAFRAPGSYDEDAAERFRSEALAHIGPTSVGRAKARWVITFADGRAQLPGESISRIRLHELGFAAPSLQVPVAAPRGRTYWIDFGLDDVEAWGEFDGRSKYRDVAAVGGRTAQEVVEDEKRREDWIRGVTNRTLVRWGWGDIANAAALGRRLSAFGVRPR